MGEFISFLLTGLAWLIIARSIMTWFPNSQNNPVVQLLNQITDPIMEPLRRLIPRVGMFDFTPMIAVLVLFFLASIVT